MPKALQCREQLIEAIVEHDDELMHSYLESHDLDDNRLVSTARKATLSMKLTPVFCGSAFKNKGVQQLLDAIIDYLPSPLDVPSVEGTHPDDSEKIEIRNASSKEAFSALAFKIMTDLYVGQLTYLRIYSGSIDSGMSVYNSVKGKKGRIGRILRMHADKREELTHAEAGDIVAVVGLKFSGTGDTFCDKNHPIILEKMEFPDPVISIAIEPKTVADEEKLSLSLQKLAIEDPTFKVHTDDETGQTVISGMGELHLEIIVDRLMREFGVGANVGKPQVAYRESITKVANAENKYIKQTGGRGQYAHVLLRVEPMERGGDFEFIDEIKGGAIPREYMSAVKVGISEALDGGVVSGYPLVDVKVAVFDGSYHEVDSSDLAFKICASMAVKEAVSKAAPVILEPVMSVEVVVPEEYMGAVTGDLTARRGRIVKSELRSGSQVLDAEVPLSNMFGYSTDLRSVTQGRATYTMQFSHYEQVPKSIAEEIITKTRGGV